MVDGDRVEIDFRSNGCFSSKTSQITIRRENGQHTAIVNGFNSTTYGTIFPEGFVPVRLTPDQVAGLDDSIAAFRRPPGKTAWTLREHLTLHWISRDASPRFEELSDTDLRHLSIATFNLHRLIDEASGAVH